MFFSTFQVDHSNLRREFSEMQVLLQKPTMASVQVSENFILRQLPLKIHNSLRNFKCSFSFQTQSDNIAQASVEVSKFQLFQEPSQSFQRYFGNLKV